MLAFECMPAVVVAPSPRWDRDLVPRAGGKVECRLCGRRFARITVTHLRKQHGISVDQYLEQCDPERFMKIISLYREGHSLDDVAALTGYAHNRVKRVLHQTGLCRTHSEAMKVTWVRHREIHLRALNASFLSAEARAKCSAGKRASEKFRESHAQVIREFWRNPVTKQAMLRGAGRKEQNPAERELGALLLRNGFKYRFVGDRTFFVGDLNPDFIREDGAKKAIELFGRWHDMKHIAPTRTEEGRKQYFADHGYQLLVIWNKELQKHPDRVIAKAREFDARLEGESLLLQTAPVACASEVAVRSKSGLGEGEKASALQ